MTKKQDVKTQLARRGPVAIWKLRFVCHLSFVISFLARSARRCQHNRHKTKRRGEKATRMPFGFAADEGGKLIPLLKEQDALLLMRELREKGLSYAKVASELNVRGISPKRSSNSA